jgi:hypothetical protein
MAIVVALAYAPGMSERVIRTPAAHRPTSEAIKALVEHVARTRQGEPADVVRLALKAEAHRRRVEYEPARDVVEAISKGTWGRERRSGTRG